MSEREYDVVIVGADSPECICCTGCASLACVHECSKRVQTSAGTWYWNRYPGARCDVESMQYSYQFDDNLQQEWSWSERYSPQPEILKYAQHVSERYNLRRDIDFNTRVTSAAYGEDSACWTLTSEEGEKTVGHYFVMATGCLSAPNWPKIDGLDSFVGPTYHTALWPHEKVDFTGQRVGVIGTGSSAIQSIPISPVKPSISRSFNVPPITPFRPITHHSIPSARGKLRRIIRKCGPARKRHRAAWMSCTTRARSTTRLRKNSSPPSSTIGSVVVSVS